MAKSRWYCATSDMNKAGQEIKDCYWSVTFTRSFDKISIFDRVIIQLIYNYNTQTCNDGFFKIIIALKDKDGHVDACVYDDLERVKDFICTDKDQVLKKFQEMFMKKGFLRQFVTAFDE